MNAGDNVDNQENFGFTESYFKIAHTHIYGCYTENKFLNMQQDHLIPQRNIENNDKQTDERYHNILIDEKESDKKYQISKNDEEKIIEDIEIMKLQNLRSKKKYIYLEGKSEKINSNDMSDNKDYDERYIYFFCEIKFCSFMISISSIIFSSSFLLI